MDYGSIPPVSRPCKSTSFTATISSKADFGPCDMPSDEELVAAWRRLTTFLRCDPVLHCAYTELEFGGNGAD